MNYQEMSWDALLRQLQLSPFSEVRREVVREMMQRIWDGPKDDENVVPMRMFDPSW